MVNKNYSEEDIPTILDRETGKLIPLFGEKKKTVAEQAPVNSTREKTKEADDAKRVAEKQVKELTDYVDKLHNAIADTFESLFHREVERDGENYFDVLAILKGEVSALQEKLNTKKDECDCGECHCHETVQDTPVVDNVKPEAESPNKKVTKTTKKDSKKTTAHKKTKK